MATVDLGNDMSMKLKDSLSMGDLEKINAASQRYDPESGQWKQDAFRGAIESVGVLVEEWTLSPPTAPTPAGFRSLPAKLGMRIQRGLNTHITSLGLTDEDLAGESKG